MNVQPRWPYNGNFRRVDVHLNPSILGPTKAAYFESRAYSRLPYSSLTFATLRLARPSQSRFPQR